MLASEDTIRITTDAGQFEITACARTIMMQAAPVDVRNVGFAPIPDHSPTGAMGHFRTFSDRRSLFVYSL